MDVQEGKVEVFLQMAVDFVGLDEEIILKSNIRNQFLNFVPPIKIARQDLLEGLLRHWLIELFADLLLKSLFPIEEGCIQHLRHHN